MHLPRSRSGWTVATLAAAVLAVLTAGGVAVAVVPDAGTGVIHGCRDTTSGALRVIDPAAGQSCSGSEAALDWNMRGITWRGTWSSTTSYAVNDAVVRNGTSYIAVQASQNSRPPSASWATLAARGKAGLVWRGPWNDSTAYAVGDAVTYQGGSYIATAATTGSLPTDTANWNVLAAAGANGSPGTPATVLWNRVVTYSNGNIYTSTGTGTVTYLGSTGRYRATYSTSVSDCSAQVTPNFGINYGTNGSGGVSQTASVGYGPGSNSLDIAIFDTKTGANAWPYGFNVAVFC